ncbi:penicillin-binding transpeptidase domain-containing protein, partial [Neisseria sp. P0016.S002]
SKMGQTLRLGMDIRMQQEADRILGDRRGALVAINPQDGTVLAFVSKPSFDPNLFIDGIDSDTWKMLNDDWKKPLINRVTQGLYPPGSTFKPFMGMALLESGKITQNTIIPAPGAWSIPGSRHIFRDSVRSGHGS